MKGERPVRVVTRVSRSAAELIECATTAAEIYLLPYPIYAPISDLPEAIFGWFGRRYFPSYNDEARALAHFREPIQRTR
jgi:hypothetical protein